MSLRVGRKGADRIRSGHPWVYSSDVLDRGAAQPGDVVEVVDPKGRTLGVAHYSSASEICVRLLSDRVEPVDRSFYLRRLRAAARHRERVVSGTEAFRLVASEADFLPGLIVDRYGDYLVMQTLTQGMERARDLVAGCLEELFAPRAIVARNDATVRARESLPREVLVLAGALETPVWVALNGLRFQADLAGGQKTGVYLDQRENYLAAARYAHGRALDCFTFSGGFALHLAARCESVEALDSSPSAIAAAEGNRAANGIANVHFRQANVFDFLTGAGGRYGTIVLDPPAFARARSALEGAVRGYKEINLRALRRLEPGGILVTCSCSHHMSEALLLETIASAALDAGRRLRVLERRTQSQDHPILLTVPETHYLKCLILEVT